MTLLRRLVCLLLGHRPWPLAYANERVWIVECLRCRWAWFVEQEPTPEEWARANEAREPVEK
jgi:hypothetical protein